MHIGLRTTKVMFLSPSQHLIFQAIFYHLQLCKVIKWNRKAYIVQGAWRVLVKVGLNLIVFLFFNWSKKRSRRLKKKAISFV